MEYRLDVLVTAPPETVFAAWADPATWPLWQAGLVAVTPLTGNRGEPGAQTQLDFELPDGHRTMVETQELVQSPHRYDAVFTSGPVTNWCRSTFAPTPDGSTAWTMDNTWAFADGPAFDDDDLLRFRNTTLSAMNAFRAFVEAGQAPAPA